MASRKERNVRDTTDPAALQAKPARVAKPKATATANDTKRRSTRLATKPRKYSVRRHKNGLLNLERTPEYLIPM